MRGADAPPPPLHFERRERGAAELPHLFECVAILLYALYIANSET